MGYLGAIQLFKEDEARKEVVREKKSIENAEQRRLRKNARMREYRAENRERREKIRRNVVQFQVQAQANSLSTLKKYLEKFKGRSVHVEYRITKKEHARLKRNVEVEYKDEAKVIESFEKLFDSFQRNKDDYVAKDVNYDVPANGFGKFWNDVSREWWITSDLNIFSVTKEGTVCFYPETTNPGPVVSQSFRDGITHCVFHPIRLWAQNLLDDAKSKQTKSRYTSMIRNIDSLEEKYARGVPENEIHSVCNLLQLDINITVPFSTEKFIEAKCEKKRLRSFNFMNTRLNHIDLNEVVTNDKPQIVSGEHLNLIKEKLDRCNTFYTFSKNFAGLTSITTLEGVFRIDSPYINACTDLEIKSGLINCKVDDVDQSELSSFILSGTHYNETVDFRRINPMNTDNLVEGNDGIWRECMDDMGYDSGDDTSSSPVLMECKDGWRKITKDCKHLDMKRAYANIGKCTFYEGILGKITDFRKTDHVEGVGLYRIDNICIPEGRFKQYNDHMHMFIDGVVYTSAELKMLDSFDVTYNITHGCWGVQSIDLVFPDEMLQKDDAGRSYYAMWVGRCDSHHTSTHFSIKGDEQFKRVIEASCGKNIVKHYENDEITISIEKKHNYHLGHVSAFVTAYTRINMIEQLMEIEFDNVIRVCVDGVYFMQDDVECKNIFRSKSDRNFNNVAGQDYCSNIIPYRESSTVGEKRAHYKTELHLGAGGSGKTHFNLSDTGLIRPIFVAPSWKLARSKKNEYGNNVSVWARIMTKDPEQLSLIRRFSNVMIFDEVSMMNEQQKKYILDTFSDMKIIMCGDIGYQLPAIEGEELTENGFYNIIKHNTNHRCKCPDLMEILINLRQLIATNCPKDKINAWCINKFKELGRTIIREELQGRYKVEDMVLSGTNEIKDVYTQMFPQLEKYYVTENNRQYSNGEIVIGEKPNVKCEIRHCFTTHSIQGETALHDLYIDSSRMFDSKMFYTAISRAKYLSQIYIIVNDQEPKFTYEHSCIYKIYNKTDVYIGSTIGNIETRLKQHERDFIAFKQGNGKYVTSFSVLETGNYQIQRIERFKCNNLRDLQAREKEVINSVQCVNKTFNDNYYQNSALEKQEGTKEES